MPPQEKNLNHYELHYVLNGVKKSLMVEKENMNELHAWLCILIIIREETTGAPTDSRKPLTQVIEVALKLGITQVRWNKRMSGAGNRPEIRFSANPDTGFLTMTTGDISLEKYRNNMP